MNNKASEIAVGAGFLALGVLLAWGALTIPSEAGYQGVGPNFLPWLVAIVLTVCGALLMLAGLTKGYQNRELPEGEDRADVWPFVWVSAALLLNALLITRIGFILSCTLAFVVAVRGFHQSQGRLDLSARAWLRDAFTGLAISAPVYWLFGKLLGISLPGITGTGWL
jgi:putative tricarboxylic transport membrane protein